MSVIKLPKDKHFPDTHKTNYKENRKKEYLANVTVCLSSHDRCSGYYICSLAGMDYIVTCKCQCHNKENSEEEK